MPAPSSSAAQTTGVATRTELGQRLPNALRIAGSASASATTANRPSVIRKYANAAAWNAPTAVPSATTAQASARRLVCDCSIASVAAIIAARSAK